MIYVGTGPGLDRLTIGFSDQSPGRRAAQHRRACVGYYEIVVDPKGTREEEQALHKRFADVRVEGTREWFLMSRAVKEWRDEMLRQHGPALAPERRETALDWLRRVVQRGHAGIAEYAKRDLDSWARLMTAAEPRGCGGGWSLTQRLAGLGERREPCSLLVRMGVDDGVVFSTISYLGVTYPFTTWVEWCEREGVAAPDGALRAGTRPRSHKVPSGRKGRPVRPVTRPGTGARAEPQDDQVSIEEHLRRGNGEAAE